MSEAIDDLGVALELPARPSRVISLVPSLTEAVAASVPGVLIGATDWCTHPGDLDSRGVVRLGGTKNPNLDAITDLAADLVIANEEENRGPDLEELRRRGVPVYVTDIRTVDQALSSISRLLGLFVGGEGGAGVDTTWLDAAAAAWADPPLFAFSAPSGASGTLGTSTSSTSSTSSGTSTSSDASTSSAASTSSDASTSSAASGASTSSAISGLTPERPRALAVVPIWRRPWMALGSDTYAGDVLRRLGVDNVLANSPERYPRFDPADLARAPVDLVVLPDEPYAFSATDGPETFPGRPYALVDGRSLTWYGPAMVEAPQRLAAALAAARTP